LEILLADFLPNLLRYTSRRGLLDSVGEDSILELEELESGIHNRTRRGREAATDRCFQWRTKKVLRFVSYYVVCLASILLVDALSRDIG
jgi:hypothetical protein